MGTAPTPVCSHSRRLSDAGVTVIIATHDRDELLRETLETMDGIAHDGLNVEWLVVDNGTSDPAVGVVIPTCNRPRALKAAMERLFSQTLQDYEVVVADD